MGVGINQTWTNNFFIDINYLSFRNPISACRVNTANNLTINSKSNNCSLVSSLVSTRPFLINKSTGAVVFPDELACP